ncbi:MAG: type II toxin-antitoxin system HicA family toxin [Cytophagaceae bacterium]|nr:type II toxin-antitoxin system HicA family toxin [Cytophagaceae bacterium]
MKRLDLIRHLEKHGCEFLREGGSHTVYLNRSQQCASTIP